MCREAAEQNDVDLRPSGWEQLLTQLDEELPVKKDKDRRRFGWLIFAGLFIGLGSLLLYPLANNNNPAHSTLHERNSSSNDPIASSSTPAIVSTVPGQLAPQSISAASGEPPANPAQVAETLQSAPGSIPKSPIQLTVTTNAQSTQAKRVQQAKKTTGDQPVPQHRLPAITVTVQPANNDFAGTVPVMLKPTLSYHPADLTGQPAVLLTRLPLLGRNMLNQPPTQSRGTIATTSRLRLGVLAGLDYSRINGSPNRQPGMNLGALLGYRLNNRLSIAAGFVLTRKNYSAQGKDFHPPDHYWTNYVDLHAVDGNCTMWDIPLIVRYDFRVRPNQRWFATAGFSSYIMREQDYTYKYTYNNNYTTRSWKTNTQANEWFKVVNLSAGIERKISRSLALQVEPFAKLSINGVGYGNMQLNSYGVLFGLNYQPQFRWRKTTTRTK